MSDLLVKAGKIIKTIKDEINYNMGHTHPGQMMDLDRGSYTSNTLRLTTEKSRLFMFPKSDLFTNRLQFEIDDCLTSQCSEIEPAVPFWVLTVFYIQIIILHVNILKGSIH